MSCKNRSPKPPHPGMILKGLFIQKSTLSLDELIENLDMDRNTLNDIIRGRACVTPDIALRFAKTFKTSSGFWLKLQEKYDLWEEDVKHS